VPVPVAVPVVPVVPAVVPVAVVPVVPAVVPVAVVPVAVVPVVPAVAVAGGQVAAGPVVGWLGEAFAGEAGQWRSALAHASANRPELILSDVMLPGPDGLALLREARPARSPRSRPTGRTTTW
jgi:hypothetical protein